MLTSEFDYALPKELIASHPSQKRQDSRLMVIDKTEKKIAHKHFYNIVDQLKAGDVLVLNDTKVMHARLFGTKEGTGAKIDILLLKRTGTDTWECLVRPAKRLKEGHAVDLGEMRGKVIKEMDEARREIQLLSDTNLEETLYRTGKIPLPPYIDEQLTEEEKYSDEITSRYQTVYASKEGACAAPTAGLHFTQELLHGIRAKGVEIEYITLHTGIGTFIPVKSDTVEEHKMHTEEYTIDDDTALNLNNAVSQGKRIIAVGTTVTRTLEHNFTTNGKLLSGTFDADIFIYPGYSFKVVNALITNFHFPRSTLIMLVSAFAGKDLTLKAYEEAKEQRYRFFSFGDSMFIH